MARSIVAAEDVPHPSPEIVQRVVNKTVARRGRLHMYETVEPTRTALVVVDLDLSVQGDAQCAQIIPRVNFLSEAVRQAGGIVAWVTSTIGAGDVEALAHRSGKRTAQRHYQLSQSTLPRERLASALDVGPDDLVVTKRASSAFFPGNCELPDLLSERRVRSVFIAGVATNVCCESSARDATELGFEVTMISDACAGHAFGLHEASLTTFFRIFGDVRPTGDAVALVSRCAEAGAAR